MTEQAKWPLLEDGAELTPMPGPDEAVITVRAEDGVRVSVAAPRAALPPSLQLALAEALAERRGRLIQDRARRAAEEPSA